jgi:hypothetical protein
MIGGRGGTEHGPDGGNNGNGGLLGGDRGGFQRQDTNQNRSRMSGDGFKNRGASNRGWQSRGRMPQQRQQRAPRPQRQAPMRQPRQSSGGGRRR